MPVQTSVSPEPTLALLDRHASRRERKLPTISTLLGPSPAAGRIWRQWLAGSSRETITLSCIEPALLVKAWLLEVCQGRDLAADALTLVARHSRQDPVEFRCDWSAKTPSDRRSFWEANRVADLPETVVRVCREATCWEGTAIQRSPALQVEALIQEHAPTADVLAPVCAVAGLVPEAAWPSLLLLPPADVDGITWLTAAASALLPWVMRLPQLPVAVVAPVDFWERFKEHAPDSRVKALLTEGLVPVPFADESVGRQLLAEAGVAIEEVAAPFQLLTSQGVTADVIQELASAVRAVRSAGNEEGAERARSAAERFLFEFLELLPDTAGRFEPNATLDFAFGHRAAEVDLVARKERLAIEIDGYFHFQDRDSYRRDRRKDWELQRRGWLVLRFLAEDVIDRLEEVRDRILQAMSCSREFPTTKEVFS